MPKTETTAPAGVAPGVESRQDSSLYLAVEGATASAEPAPPPAGNARPAAPDHEADGAVPPVWKPRDVLLDLYEVKQGFESGGMGFVYRRHHRGCNADLAVKSPRPEYFRTERHKENYEREAETWVNLGLHPHVASCYYVRRLGGIP